MALLLKDGSIFLHIPKTGGNWVTTVLREQNLVRAEFGHKHADLAHLFSRPAKRRLRNLPGWLGMLGARRHWARGGKPFMFCFVRHPLTWYESWFKYMNQAHTNWRNFGDEKSLYDWHPNAVLNGLGSTDFNRFVRNVAARRPGYVTELYGAYTAPAVDFVGKQENLREDLIRVLTRLGLEFDEAFIRSHREVGVSSPQSVEVAWDAELRQQVEKLEYAGLVRYGY